MKTKTTDTPRTDAVAIDAEHPVSFEYSTLETFARELERENKRLETQMNWYKSRYSLLCINQSRFGEGKERTLLVDILANGQTLPDPNGTRYPYA